MSSTIDYEKNDSESPYDKIIIEIDADTAYACFGKHGALLSENAWKIKKLFKDANGYTTWRWGSTSSGHKDHTQMNKKIKSGATTYYDTYYYETN